MPEIRRNTVLGDTMEHRTMHPPRDKHGNILKIGDTIRNRKGETRKLENIGGVTMAVERDDNNRIIKTTVLRKIDLMQMERVR